MSPVPAKAKFVFNPANSDNDFIKERRKEAEKLRNLIDDLQQRVIVANSPIFEHLVKYMPKDVDFKEVKTLGKALVKWAEIKPQLDKLEKELNVVDTARENPDLLALAFADSDAFSKELDQLLNDLSE